MLETYKKHIHCHLPALSFTALTKRVLVDGLYFIFDQIVLTHQLPLSTRCRMTYCHIIKFYFQIPRFYYKKRNKTKTYVFEQFFGSIFQNWCQYLQKPLKLVL